jgi:hypothetical protein
MCSRVNAPLNETYNEYNIRFENFIRNLKLDLLIICIR